MNYFDTVRFLSGTFTVGTTVDFGDGYIFTVGEVDGYYLRNDSASNNITLLTALAAKDSFKVEKIRAKAYDFGKVECLNEHFQAFPEFADLDSLRDYCRYLKCLKEKQRVWTKSDLPFCNLKTNDLVYLYNAHTGYKGFSTVVDSPSGMFMVNGITTLWDSLKLCSSEAQCLADKFGRRGSGYFPFMDSEECLRNFLTAICEYDPKDTAHLELYPPEGSSVPYNFYDSTASASTTQKTEAVSTSTKTENPNDYTIKLKGIHLNNPSSEDIKTTITL